MTREHEQEYSELVKAVDYLAVSRLQAAYADGVNRRDWSAVTELFLPGAVVELDLVDRPARTLRGAHELVGFVSAAIERYAFFEFVVLNSHVDLWPDGDRGAATARMFMCELRADAASGERSQAFGLYQDTYRKVGAHWRIAGRTYRSMARFPAGDVFPLPS